MKTRVIQDDPHDPTTTKENPTAAPAEPTRPSNFAARMGGWSARHWKTAVFGWLALVVASFLIGNVAGTKYLEASDSNVGEALKADKIIEAGFPKKFDEQGEMVLVQHPTLTADDPAFKAVVTEVTTTLDGFPKVRKLNSPYEAGHDDLISDDRHSVMVNFSPKGVYEEAVTYIQTIEAGVNKVAKSNPGFYVDELGSVSTERELDIVFNGMIKTAGMIAIPLALLILFFVFGSAVAALVPLLLALTAVFATIGLVSLPSQIFPVDEQIGEVILLIGLAVGIDYSLFYLKREREEIGRAHV